MRFKNVRTRILVCISCAFLLLCVGLAHFVFVKRQKTLVSLETGFGGEIRVIADSLDLLDGWHVAFCWRKDREPWRAYYLDHEATLMLDWPDTHLQVCSNVVYLFSGAEERASLDMETGVFCRPGIGLFTEATWFIDSDNPFDRSAEICKDSPRRSEFEELDSRLVRNQGAGLQMRTKTETDEGAVIPAQPDGGRERGGESGETTATMFLPFCSVAWRGRLAPPTGADRGRDRGLRRGRMPHPREEGTARGGAPVPLGRLWEVRFPIAPCRVHGTRKGGCRGSASSPSEPRGWRVSALVAGRRLA